jgi:hypothetical protein
MKKKKSNISFSLLSLSVFLFLTFTFSSHAFCLPVSHAYSLENISTSKQTKVSAEKNDLNESSFLSEAEEVEETETEDHFIAFHLPAVLAFYTSFFHTQETNNSLLSYTHLKFTAYSTPVFIKNCTFLI